MNRLLAGGYSLLGERLGDGLPGLTPTSRLEDEIEVRLEFALKRLAGHTHAPDGNPVIRNLQASMDRWM